MLLFAAVYITSCKEGDELGINVLPVTDSTSFKEGEAQLISSTIKGENASDAGIHNALLGSYKDPVFGQTKADFAIKYYPGTFAMPFDDSTRIDSAKLFLRYSQDTIGKYFGDKNSTISYSIHHLKTSLKANDEYSRDSLEYTPEAFAEGEFKPLENNDTLFVTTLNDAFVEKLSDTAQTDSYSNSANFSDAFPGLYIKLKDAADPGALTFFHPYHSDSKIRIYYRDLADKDTLNFSYTFNNGYCANLFTHDFTGKPVESHLNNDPAVKDSIVYIQGTGGTRGLLKFPSIKEWRNIDGKTVLINKAELVVEPAANQNKGVGLVKYPYELVLMRMNENGLKYPLEEYLTPNTYLGESVNAETGNYHFTITRYVQKLISGERPNNGLYLMVRNSSEDPGRILIKGSEHNDSPIKLKLHYSLL